MKRFALLGVILAAGLGYGVYQMTRSDASSSQTSSSSSAATPGSAAPHETPPRPTERRVETDPTTASAMPTRDPAAGTATNPATNATAGETAVTAPGADTTEAATASEPGPHSTSAFKERTPVGSAAEESPEAIRRAMNLRVQRAACQAPGIEQRYRKLDAAGRAKLAARCREAGVVLADPK